MKTTLTIGYCLILSVLLTAEAAAFEYNPCLSGWMNPCPNTLPEMGCIEKQTGCDTNGNELCNWFAATLYKSNGTDCTVSGEPNGEPGECHAGECLTLCPDTDGDGICDEMDSCIGGFVAGVPENGLCWEKDPWNIHKTYDEAVTKCADSELGGYNDWRLPTLDELRSIITGCPSQELGGSCTVVDPNCPYDPQFEWDEVIDNCLSPECEDCPSVGPGHAAAFLEDRTSPYWSGDSSSAGPWAWGVNFSTARIFLSLKQWRHRVRCVRDYVPPCDDSDGDTVCDANDVCPGGDDRIDEMGHKDGGPNQIPDHCDCENFDVAGTTLLLPGNVVEIHPDQQLTFGSEPWWSDDLMACYHTYSNPAFMPWFGACDRNGSGLVEVEELFEMYYFLLNYPGSEIPYAAFCPSLP